MKARYRHLSFSRFIFARVALASLAIASSAAAQAGKRHQGNPGNDKRHVRICERAHRGHHYLKAEAADTALGGA